MQRQGIQGTCLCKAVELTDGCTHNRRATQPLRRVVRQVRGADPDPDGPSPIPALFVFHGGHRYAVTTTDFVIGRSRAACDLPILDNRIARKHAAVIHRNGRYYLKDLGSADGVHYKSMPIDNKRIDEGDVFQIGDHDLRFTYRAGEFTDRG